MSSETDKTYKDFSWWARGLGIGSLLAILTTSIVAMTNHSEAVGLSIYGLFLGLFLIFVELPACCSCVPACQRVVTVLKVCNTYWMVRGVSYMVLAAVGIVIWVFEYYKRGLTDYAPVLILVSVLVLAVDGILYVVAGFRHESTPIAPENNAVPKQSAAAAAGFSTEPVDKPPTQQSLAQSWFGIGAGSSAPKPATFGGDDAHTPLASSGGDGGYKPPTASSGGYGQLGGGGGGGGGGRGGGDDDNPFSSAGSSSHDVNPFA